MKAPKKAKERKIVYSIKCLNKIKFPDGNIHSIRFSYMICGIPEPLRQEILKEFNVNTYNEKLDKKMGDKYAGMFLVFPKWTYKRPFSQEDKLLLYCKPSWYIVNNKEKAIEIKEALNKNGGLI